MGEGDFVFIAVSARNMQWLKKECGFASVKAHFSNDCSIVTVHSNFILEFLLKDVDEYLQRSDFRPLCDNAQGCFLAYSHQN